MIWLDPMREDPNGLDWMAWYAMEWDEMRWDLVGLNIIGLETTGSDWIGLVRLIWTKLD